MNGRAHALIGSSIIPVTALGGGLPLAECAVLTAISAGCSLGPDIDHPNSTISRSLGAPVHHLFRSLSLAARTMMSTGRDRQAAAHTKLRGHDPAHRSLTHTLVFASAVGGTAWLLGQHRISIALFSVLSVFVCRRLLRGRWQLTFLGGGCAVAFASLTLSMEPTHVALAATAGWMSHIIADACTTSGVPVLWPLRIKDRRWWRLRLLGSWLRSGDRKEYVAALGVIAVMHLPYLLMA